MASTNTFASLRPLFKDTYADSLKLVDAPKPKKLKFPKIKKIFKK